MEQSIQLKQPKPRKRKIITAVIIFIIFLAIVYWGWTEYNQWWQARKEYVRMGLAEDKFPYRMYTERELVEKGKWPVESEYYTSIPTRITPEETYAIFRQALIDGDLDKAAECFVKEKQEEYKNSLIKAKEEERIDDILKQLTEIYPRGKRIVKGANDTNMITYEFFIIENGNRISHPIGFAKDIEGNWKMKNL